jgi:hypothetical protein
MNYTTWRFAKMNLAIRGIEGQIAHGDTFHAGGAGDEPLGTVDGQRWGERPPVLQAVEETRVATDEGAARS